MRGEGHENKYFLSEMGSNYWGFYRYTNHSLYIFFTAQSMINKLIHYYLDEITNLATALYKICPPPKDYF